MNRFFFLALGLVSLAASAGAATESAPAGRMTAAQIADRNVAARGGLQAWRAVNSLTMSGQIDVGGKKEVKLPFVATMKRPHKSRFELRFQEQTALQVYDGTQGWKVRPFLGRDEVEPYTPAEARVAAAAAELDGPLVDYARKGIKLELQGMESVEGHQAYRLKLTMQDRVERRLWVDATSFLEVKMDGEPRKLDGRMHNVAVYYRDYKAEGGLKIPHVMETVVEGVKKTHQMTIQQVTVNQPVDDALFAKPQLASAKVPGK
ncbi:outer membrane lipoprotein-sorting protein [Cupriavidus basilensis]|uniref:Outer membrane lipoprotein-sorting protein n=1 Tax=Cupriavidus basilensis TaxID=68895 RepID=A0ABT6B3X0_9BURK|nr:outer membrane lipoprotein-sorting protein [Cupriavidus basilensis]MDF3839580.1 outer membrane lipoprotein-sorting protein [Cupriavidus basilensis]